jgi:hypothetical protein
LSRAGSSSAAGHDRTSAIRSSDRPKICSSFSPGDSRRHAATEGDHYSVGLGQGLETSGEIGCVAGDIVLGNLAADDNQPGGNPHPRMKLFGLIELRHPIDQRQPASSGALGIVLVRLRIAEINQDAVAHIAGAKPAKARDNLCDAAMIGPDDPAQILGIEPRG